jgi:hypothetical protein
MWRFSKEDQITAIRERVPAARHEIRPSYETNLTSKHDRPSLKNPWPIEIMVGISVR